MRPSRIGMTVGLLISAIGPWTANPDLQIVIGLALSIISVLTIRPEVIAVIPFVLGHQWVQISTGTLYANSLGIKIESLYPVGDPRTATLYGLVFLMVATVVATVLSQRFCKLSMPKLTLSLNTLSIERLRQVYLGLLVLVLILLPIIGFSAQFYQVFKGLSDLRWAVFLAIIATSIVQRKRLHWTLGIFLFELIFGMSGYFSSFSIPIFFALLAFASAFTLLRREMKFTAYALVGLMFSFGAIWNVIKNDYRRVVSENSSEQIVSVGVAERYSTLGNMVGETLTGETDLAVDKFAMRLAYVDFFGIVLNRVPSELPHREGELLGTALTHILVPRAIYPDKPPLPSDSELTAQYTGDLNILLMTGTSISLGFATECYIDFGFAGVILAGLILAGLLVGVTTVFQRLVPDPLLAIAMSCAALIDARLFEIALPKLLGGVLASLLMQWLIVVLVRRWIAPDLLRRQS